MTVPPHCILLLPIMMVLIINTMYRRFLNNNDYLSIITPEALVQITRGNTECFIQAEESAEMNIKEYLSENYEIEAELNKGKYIAEYNRMITYPVGAHICYDNKICEVIRSISGYKSPASVEYWEEYLNIDINATSLPSYSQFATYKKGDIILYKDIVYICLNENGYKFRDIRIPLVSGWLEVEYVEWEPVEYSIWEVVKFDKAFYTLVSLEGFDNNKTPKDSECWGEIADYDPNCNKYELNDHEYVVYNGTVFYPEMDVNADVPEISKNLCIHDPRNYNVKKHMVRLALYELTKLIAANNVSIVRLKDYETSMKWLSDAAKLKLNPQIPRKLAEDKQEIMDWQLATFQTRYDPYQNPWMI